jgi:putative transcriptional regulator
MIINNNFKNLILKRSADKGKRITYKDISKATGITISTLSRFAVKPTYSPRYEYLVKLSNFFEVPINQLVTFDNNDKRKPAPPAVELQKEC